MPNVLLADDHVPFLTLLGEAVSRAGMTVVGKATTGDELLRLVAQRDDLDAVVVDLKMPGRDGFECLELLRRERPSLMLIVVSGSTDEEDVERAIQLGAVCYVGKSVDPADVAGALRVMLIDAIRVAPRDRSGPAAAAAALLTARELEILRLVAEGRSNADIARTLWVTEQTVKFHLTKMYRKIGVSNRTGAGRWAQQHGLV
ncbi:MAG TPA: response regulator transcription factor [Gaiellaceae bacterium]